MSKRIFSFIFSFIFLIQMTAFADGNKNSFNNNYKNIVTEYYSDDIYEDTVTASTSNTGAALSVNSKSAVLMEASTGKIIFAKNENEKLPPASITKIMTMLLVIEAIEDKRLSFYDNVTASEHSASMGGSQIWLEVGEKMSVHDLLKAVAVGSANDASVALAEHLAGSEEAFVTQMNSKAKELGMTNTNFSNACGLDDDNLYTTAKDIAIMSKELISHDLIKQYTTIWMDTVRNETVQLVNTNKLVRFYKGATGLKTGTTSKAGCCLSATAKRGEMELIAVIMGAENSKERFSEAKKLLDYGFSGYCIYNPLKNLKIKKKLPIKNGQSDFVELDYDKIGNKLISIADKNNISISVNYKDNLSAPLTVNEKVGEIIIFVNKKVLSKHKIFVKETVEKVNFKFSFLKLLEKTICL